MMRVLLFLTALLFAGSAAAQVGQAGASFPAGSLFSGGSGDASNFTVLVPSGNARTLVGMAADETNILNKLPQASGSTDFTAALNTALASTVAVRIPNTGTAYLISGNGLTLGAGASLLCDPGATINYTGTNHAFTINGSGATIQGCAFEAIGGSGTPAVGTVTSDHFTFVGNTITGMWGMFINQSTAFGGLIKENHFISGLSTALEFENSAHDNKIEGNEFQGNAGFGIWGTLGAYNNAVIRNYTNANTLELVGLTYTAHGWRVEENSAIGTCDNGISITGYNNVVTGNYVYQAGHTGIYAYGDMNSITGNVVLDSGQVQNAASPCYNAADSNTYSNITINGNYGGAGANNVMSNNASDDDQATPTTSYAGAVGSGYAQWTTGNSYSQNGYVYNAQNVYENLGVTANAGATAPTCTSGTCSDGTITWTWIRTMPYATREPEGNSFTFNKLYRYKTAQFNDATINHKNNICLLSYCAFNDVTPSGTTVANDIGVTSGFAKNAGSWASGQTYVYGQVLFTSSGSNRYIVTIPGSGTTGQSPTCTSGTCTPGADGYTYRYLGAGVSEEYQANNTSQTIWNWPFCLATVDIASSSNCMYSGQGNPNGKVTASIGAIYLRTDGGPNGALFIKEVGTDNNGWNPGLTSVPIVINVGAPPYNAICDGSTDTSTAINSALSDARTAATTNHHGVTVVLPGNGVRCKITSTLNLTGFAYPSVIFDLNGANIYAAVSGAPCLDAQGSTNFTIENGEIIGDATSVCTNGLQTGRIAVITGSAGLSGAIFNTRNLTITGSFSNCGYYNYAGEEDQNYGLKVSNSYNTGTVYAQCYDGGNHMNVSSAFATITAPTDVAQSFNEVQVYGGSAECSGTNTTCTPIFLNGTRGFRSLGWYYYNAAGADAVTMYTEPSSYGGAVPDIDLTLDIHAETGSGSPLTDLILLTGQQAVPVLKNFKMTEPALFASNSLIKIDSGSSVTSATCFDCDIRVPGGPTTPTTKFFDNANLWTITGGHFSTYYPAMWNAPAGSLTADVVLSGISANQFGPLDFLPTTCGGVGVRRLISAYKGPLINVTNSASATADIYQNASGDLDIGALSAFLAGSAGTVNKWYWQGDAGNNATQSTTASQPAITLQLSALGNRPALVFGANTAAAMSVADNATVQNIFATGGYILSVTDQIAATNTTNRIWQKVGNYFIAESTQAQYALIGSTSPQIWTTSPASNGSLLTELQYTSGSPGSAFNSNNPLIYYNQIAQSVSLTTAGVGTVGSDVSVNLLIGNRVATGGNNGYPGDMAEFIACTSQPATLNREATLRNEATYYSLSGIQ